MVDKLKRGCISFSSSYGLFLQAYFDHICSKMVVRIAASALASLHSNLGTTSHLLGFNSTAILFRTDLSPELNFSALFPSIDGFYGAMKVCNSGRKTVVRSKSGGVSQDDLALSLLQPGQLLEAASRSLRPPSYQFILSLCYAF